MTPKKSKIQIDVCLGCGKHKFLYRFYCADCINARNYKEEDELEFTASQEWLEEMIEDAKDQVKCESFFTDLL